MDKIEKGKELKRDPRLGKRVLFLDETERYGYDVIGELIAIKRFANGDEIWRASLGGWICSTSSKLYKLIEEAE